MEINEFIAKFAEALDGMDPSLLTPETNFRELNEWSSLAALNIIALADEDFDKELSVNELRSTTSIKELFEVIKK